jgi:CheY-like chemotaxis protein
MEQSKKIVWLVDDDDTDAKQYKRFLNGGDKLHVEIVTPLPRVQDYANLLTNPETGAFILDHRLFDFKTASYTGLELANDLRALRPELPIFILTQYADDEKLQGQERSVVEAIIAKDKMRNRQDCDVYVTRILRSIKRYEDALTEKQKCLQNLVDKKISGRLTNEEANELAKLRFDVERPADLLLAQKNEKWEAELKAEANFLAKFREMQRDYNYDFVTP